MTTRPRLLLCLCAVLAALPAPPTAAAEIGDLEVSVDGNLAHVDFQLRDAFDAELVERLESGLPTGFTYHLELLRDRQWFDRSLENGKLQVVAMYDAATRGYLVNYKLNGKLVESRMVRELADVERALTDVEELPAFHLDPYPRAWRLLVRVRAVVGSRRVLFLIPARAITDWTPSRKFRTLNELPDGS
jgi:hypothetical protein